MRFAKYHASGNDYLVLEESESRALTPAVARRICDRHLGLGADGILLRVRAGDSDYPRLRIFNPDGSEAEKSGNGLRIFARYLWDRALVGEEPFPVATLSGKVFCVVSRDGRAVTVDMGLVSFDSMSIPVAGPRRRC